MKAFRFDLTALGLLGLMVTAACSNNGQVRATPESGAAATGLALYARPTVLGLRSQHLRTWISPDVKSTRAMLFESDGGYTSVEIFTLPGLKLRGVVTGFAYPEGLCADANGNVWVADMGALTITQLSRSGKVLQQKRSNFGYPASCAINPTNGDLAVSDVMGFSYAGAVELYQHASGSPTILSCAGMAHYFFVGYDGHGNLFLDGFGYDQKVHLCRGKDAKTSLLPMVVAGSPIYWPGMVQWYAPGNYLALGDQKCSDIGQSCIYKVSISGVRGTVVGATKPLNYTGGPICDLAQGAIAPGKGLSLLGGDASADCNGATTAIDRWAYPVGGAPQKYYDNLNYIKQPIGAAVSVAPR